MSLMRFLGLGGGSAGREAEPASLVELGASLESMEPDEARLAERGITALREHAFLLSAL